MKYFIWKSSDPNIGIAKGHRVIWCRKKNGLEKCVYDSWGTDPSKWVHVADTNMDPLEECDYVEISKEEAFIEML